MSHSINFLVVPKEQYCLNCLCMTVPAVLIVLCSLTYIMTPITYYHDISPLLLIALLRAFKAMALLWGWKHLASSFITCGNTVCNKYMQSYTWNLQNWSEKSWTQFFSSWIYNFLNVKCYILHPFFVLEISTVSYSTYIKLWQLVHNLITQF